MLLRRDANARIAHGEGKVVPRERDAQVHAPLLGKLEGVGEQVFENLLQPLPVGRNRGRTVLGDVDGKGQAALAGDGIKGLAQIGGKPRQGYGLGSDLDMPSLDLRQVEDVVDEIEQIVARRLDGAGELDLFVREIALRVVAEQL